MNLILAVNAGSSSLKFKLINMPEEVTLAEGNIERIGHDDAIVNFKTPNEKVKKIIPVKNHEEAVELLEQHLIDFGVLSSLDEIKGVGHRVVHGGEKFKDSALIDDDVINEIANLSDLAPLHNPHNLRAIQIFRKKLPNVPMVAVFDTAFHQTMPKKHTYMGYHMNGMKNMVSENTVSTELVISMFLVVYANC